MAKRRVRGPFSLYDNETEQVLPGSFLPEREKGIGRAYMMVFQQQKGALLRRHPEVHAASHVVFGHLEALVRYGNILPSPKEMAMEMGLHGSAVSRCYRELMDAEFIWKRGQVYYMSPLVGWKGSTEELRAAIYEYADNQARRAAQTMREVDIGG